MPEIHDTIIHLVIPYMACGVTLMLSRCHGYGHADNALSYIYSETVVKLVYL